MAVILSVVPVVSEPVTTEEEQISNAWLHVVVVRLLAVSLTMTRSRPRRSDGMGKGLPHDNAPPLASPLRHRMEGREKQRRPRGF